ncbi:Uncharacterized protein LSUE1_G006168 [Lachnellula suecica]|uniref:PQ loop repeat protein n=1 Tax=Lachnellula suecica TaxID=602035 RepID=A0A8T9C580_9HELO|nr:Uncharacterized protein LSUE1_G006168 [Lachnellula suecica]
MGLLQSLDDLGSRCEKLQDVSYINLALSIFILIGIFASYLPQHYRIISRETSEGISPWFILLGATSGTCAFANILVLPVSRADIACCKTVGTFECVAGLLGIAQVGVQWSCFTVILLLFLIFFPRGPALSQETTHSWKLAVSVAIICLVHGLAVILISIVLIATRPHALGIWASILGIMGAVLATIQYLPQIWLTHRIRDVGSLSIPMMCIQTPGSFLWSGSLIARLGWAGWSSWGIFLVTGFLQGCLLALGVYYSVKNKRAKSYSLRHDSDENSDEGDSNQRITSVIADYFRSLWGSVSKDNDSEDETVVGNDGANDVDPERQALLDPSLNPRKSLRTKFSKPRRKTVVSNDDAEDSDENDYDNERQALLNPSLSPPNTEQSLSGERVTKSP